MKVTLQEISRALDGKLCGNGAKIITDVSFDSRSCHEGTLFAALKGEKHDGHEFIPLAVEQGAAVLCSHRPDCPADAVVMPDVGAALIKLAVWYKSEKCSVKTVAVTGSVGKTTTKDLTACVLSSQYKTHKNQGNFNNILGLPMTILGLEPEHEMLVVEMGMNHAGEIETLTNIAHPDIGIITNIGTSHIGNLHSRENICKAKMEIICGMKKGSTLILNGDEPLLHTAAESIKGDYDIIFAGLDHQNDVFADDIDRSHPDKFVINYAGKRYPAKLAVPGIHNIYDALLAFCAGVKCGIEPQHAADAINDFHSVGIRQNLVEKDGIKVIADCYNASRESMCASLGVLCGDIYSADRRIAVLGEMLELGEQSAELHRDVGAYVARKMPDMLYTLAGAKLIAEGAVDNGYPKERCFHYEDKEALYQALSSELKAGDLVLFKASRDVSLKEIIYKLGFEIK